MSQPQVEDKARRLLDVCSHSGPACWRCVAMDMERQRDAAEARLADLAGCIRVELQGVIEEVEAFNRCTQFKVLLAQREEGSTWGVWSLPLPSADAARALGANLYRPTSAVVFLRVPEAP